MNSSKQTGGIRRKIHLLSITVALVSVTELKLRQMKKIVYLLLALFRSCV